MEYGGELSMEESGVWSVEYGKYGLCPLVEYESESGVIDTKPISIIGIGYSYSLLTDHIQRNINIFLPSVCLMFDIHLLN